MPPATIVTKERKRILGLRIPILAGIVALIVVIALGVGIGVGVGVGHHKSSSKDSAGSASSTTPSIPDTTSASSSGSESASKTSNSSPTSTGSAPATSGTTGIAAINYKTDAPQTYRSDTGTTFVQYCFADWPRNDDAFEGEDKVHDLGKVTVYTMQSCMDACEKYNDDLGSDGTKCMAVTYNANLTSSISNRGANCFLKDRRGVDVLAGGLVASVAIASS